MTFQNQILRIGMLASCWVMATSLRADDAADVSRLTSIWKAQKDEIVTARIKCRLFRDGDLAPLTPKEIRKLLASVKLDSDPAGFTKIVNGILPEKRRSARPWVEVNYDFEQKKVRRSDKTKHGLEIAVRDGTNQVSYSGANKMAQIGTPGISTEYLESLNDFRFIQNPAFLPPVRSRSDSRITFADESYQLIVNSATGAVYEAAWSRAGRVNSEILQDFFVSYPGNILFPSLHIEANYGDAGRLKHISISWIESAEFNRDLGSDTFNVVAPKGTRVIDKREPGVIRVANVRSEDENVVSLADATIQPPSTKPFPFWVIVLVALVVCCSALSWYLVSRRKE